MTKLSKAFNALLPLWFFLCFEYQAVFSPHEYSLITAAGLVILVIVKYLTTAKNIRQNSLFSLEQKKSAGLGSYEKISATAYIAAMVLCVFLGAGVAMQMAFIMIVLIMAVTFFSLKEGKMVTAKVSEDQVVKANFTFTTNFILPIVFLSFVNYLLSVQIASTFAFQSIIVVSTMVLADMIYKEHKWMKLLTSEKITDEEFKHLLFYRWNRYWSFFLGTWYFLSLRSNGAINQTQSYILIFAFAVIYFIFLIREVAILKTRELFTIALFALILTVLNPLTIQFLGTEIADYWQAALLFVAFDIGNVYFFQSHVEKVGARFWSHKGALYITAVLYIIQVNIMMTNPEFTLQNVYAKFFFEKNSQEIYSSVLQSQDQSPVTLITTPDNGSFISR
jgi:hypothetical protein